MMKNNTQIMLLVIAVLFLSMITTMVFTILSINDKGQKDIKAYEENKIKQVKQSLKSYVDIAYAMIRSNDQNSKLEHNLLNSEEKSYLEKYYGHRLESIIDLAELVLQKKVKQVRTGQLSLKTAQRQAKQEIKQFRYDNDKGYIWINDTNKPYPKMVMHPTLPFLEGQVLKHPNYETVKGENNLLDAQDKNLFIAFTKVCEAKGDGYVGYFWPKPNLDGLTDDQPKLSYVRLFKEWDWIIGTGIYIDDAIEDGKIKTIHDIKQMRYDEGVGYFWINDTTQPTPKMIMHPTKPELEGQIMNDKKYNTTLGKYTEVKKGQNLFEAFMEVCETKGSGYIDYKWPKPTKDGLTEAQPKMSYVKLYEPLGWIVGSGAYIDDIENEIQKRKEAINDQINSLILQQILAFFFITLIATPTMIILYFLFQKFLSNKKSYQET